MIRLPKKLLFAVEAVLDIAYNAGTQPVQSKEITARQGIPRRYLEQVLQQLVRAGILSGIRGPRGGYLLARERRRITLGDITRVISALDANGEDAKEEAGVVPESDLGVKIVRPIWDDMQNRLVERLDSVTIEELCLKAKEAGIDSEAAQRLDFVI
ncbi:MAG: Rrf2 family transcriptional regulator [Alphaproteobacteria bacterium]|nr:Rrf2 family transcriptional regulator [Alphaproteobacteria bacterium]